MKIATWNVNSLRVRLEHLLKWMKQADPDVICLQETKMTDDKFPLQAIIDAGYPHVIFKGQPTYNGVAMISKHPIEDPSFVFDGFDDPAPRIVIGTVKAIKIYGLYTPNGKNVTHKDFDYKLRWLDALRTSVQSVPCLLYTSPSPRDQRGSRMPSSA